MSSPKRIAIIGGGPAGLACLRAFHESPDTAGWGLALFEARDEIGGVWYRNDGLRLKEGTPPASPIYDSLTTNLPHCIMAYNEFMFPASTNLFPPASTVQQYLLDYAAHFGLRKHIHLQRRVTHAEWDTSKSQWSLQLSGPESEQSFYTCEHLVVANGHYNIPHIPAFLGLGEWIAASGGKRTAMHSTWYREPSPYKSHRVLVIGGGPSGQDLSAEIASVAEATYHSVREFIKDDESKAKKRGQIAFFDSSGCVVYEDGTRDRGVDRVILATGYEFSFPMLQSLLKSEFPPSGTPIPNDLYASPTHVHPLARHVFPVAPSQPFPRSALAFIGLPSRVAPFPLCEAQAIAAARVFAHPDTLDVEEERKLIKTRWKCLGKDERVIAKLWHRLPNLEQFEYRRELYDLAGWKEWDVEQWIIDGYMNKDVIREQWKDVQRCGEAESYVKGVDSKEGWRQVLLRLIRRSEGKEVVLVRSSL